MAKFKGIKHELSKLSTSDQKLETQLENLIEQKKYTQAIRKLQQTLKRKPDVDIKIREADIWLAQGKDEFERAKYDSAEKSLREAIAQQLYGDSHYWLAKTLLAQEKIAPALDIIQTAFDDKTLPKDFGGCYLKLLFLNGKDDVVETLIKSQAKRFYAPQLHWARGILAMKAGDSEEALEHFQKMGRPASPNDTPSSWRIYAEQSAGRWHDSEHILKISPPGFEFKLFKAVRKRHPATQVLALRHVALTHQNPAEFIDLDAPDVAKYPTALVLAMLYLIRHDNSHDAAHLAIDLSKPVLTDYPELESLYRPLMLKAGEQARMEGELACSADFWGKAIDEKEFDPNLALHLHGALRSAGSPSETQNVLHQIINWVRQNAKQQPETWPEQRLNSTLAKLYCWLADSQMRARHTRDGERSVREAEKYAPNHPEVIGRKGLEAYVKGKWDAAVTILTQALEAGCRFDEVYSALLNTLEKQGDSDAAKAVRRKFGKHFGDTTVDTEVDVPLWVEALTAQNYVLMEQTVKEQKKPTPPIQALQIFLNAAEDEPSSSQKITLNQKKATAQWDELLRSHSPADQVDILKAIYLVVYHHARRNKKGMSALQSQYFQKLIDLKADTPEAMQAHLVLLPLRNLPPDRLKMAVMATLNRSPQPGNFLARTQLEMRRFYMHQAFRPFIDEYLEQEPQNPLLLLAKATLYPRNSRDYQTFYDQGFEIARRLQDAEALQAYREEDWFKANEMTVNALGNNVNLLNDPSQMDMLDVLQNLARQTMGVDIPPEILAGMLPELEAQMNGDFDDDDFDDDPFFIPVSRKERRQSSSKKRKPWFEL
ncbi:MAG: tetratricopeptide repeat protein [Leptolyngbyaceae bacterium]|nr:tetratricopeptide repeat protein [Leptolyngbyaceae bacterium]